MMDETKKRRTVAVVVGVGLGLGGFALIFLSRAKAAPPAGEAHLYGVVTDTETIESVKVTIDGQVAYTDINGEYSFVGLALGSYTIAFEKADYETAVSDIVLIEGLNELNVQMVPLPTAEFAYVSGITFSHPAGELDYFLQADVDIQNTGSVAAICTVNLQDRIQGAYEGPWGGWHDFRTSIANLMSALLQPGEIRTFFGTVWYVSQVNPDQWEVRFIGAPGEIRENLVGNTPGPP